MAELVLSRVGAAIGGALVPIPGVGALLGATVGGFFGGAIDQAVFGQDRRLEGPRLTDLHLQGSTEGASIPAAYGRVRLAGQMIWAARFKEHVQVERRRPSGGGKGGVRGPAVTETAYAYTLSFAVGLCEGPAGRIARVWANGEELDPSEFAWRFHPGTEDQPPDPLIEAIEGAQDAPAYRGLAYVVFEDLPLARWGNVPPQLSFEIVRAVPNAGGGRLEDMAGGVCLIPGAGEFVYASAVVRRAIGPGAESPENMHAEAERANLLVSLDQLQADLPNCSSVMLVVSWFGNDLRCASCAIRPGVEIAEKETRPRTWRAGGVGRAHAHLISEINGGPAFGGTPADFTVVQAIQELKARGFRVGLYPFILMDVPPGSALPDPYGGGAQAVFPWRGRITCDPAPGQIGSPDKTSAAGEQVAAFFGAAAPGDFAVAGDEVEYAGPAEWSFRRFILHCAKLAEAAGGVHAFVLGSELRGLTQVRDGPASYPAVAALKALAADVRGVLDAIPAEPALSTDATLTYAADWSEYFGHHPQDGSGDVFFHLDPLWGDDAIDCVGIDWYAPLADWRDGAGHADAGLAASPYDPAYLEGRIEAGETFDWYYASEADRAAQARTSIADGAYGKPWVFRAKDVRAWWSNAHYDRPAGVESAAPTAWVAQSKPVWFVEFGCPAIDKGANAPNLFVDPKSSESAAPPFSRFTPDDLIQRRALEAYLRHWSGPANPVSAAGVAMIAMQGAHIWAWDARPYPQFPARRDVWSDGGAWRLGHWLNGRVGAANLGDVVGDLCRRAGLEAADTSALAGIVGGYVVDSPASARAAIEPLMRLYDFDAAEIEGALVFTHAGAGPVAALALDALVQEQEGRAAITRGDGGEAPLEARVRFLDPARDHRVAMASARSRDAAGRAAETIDAPLSLSPEQARDAAEHALARGRARTESVALGLPPSLVALTPGDRVHLGALGADRIFRFDRIEEGPTRRATLYPEAPLYAPPQHVSAPAAPAPLVVLSAPEFVVLDLPPLPGAEGDGRPLAAVFASPWPGPVDVYAGASAETASWRGRAETPAIIGALEAALPAGPVGRWDEANVLRVRLAGGALESVDHLTLFAGANAFAVEKAGGGWEVLQAREALLAGPDVYELRGLLRGQLGTEFAMGAPEGSRLVKLDRRLARLDVGAHEMGASLVWAAAPAGRGAVDPAARRIVRAWADSWARPFAPAHLSARRTGTGDVEIGWIRRTRLGGDSWEAAEVPLAEEREAWRIEIMEGAGVARVLTAFSAPAIYPAGAQIEDFGSLPGAITVRIAQISAVYGQGTRAESGFTL